ncbi:amidohydrolase [Marinobacterium aestuarii]|uniref:Amidohydrolase n=1 Tax=Marinobacterium aestuarii TaxID=1821621 RepID=A0A1A9EU86_9GAMM|nr:amidohydrolase [Marinobacterium aestuarii]ANG61300.1 amidohydrolase [Marinobacterium aestuarii]
MSITVFAARRIITMNPSQPQASHIAVRDGRVLAVGPLESMQELGDYSLDERFADNIILPGFVEGHSHALEGAMWDYLYLGYFPRTDPDGRRWEGASSIEAMQQCLREAAAELAPDAPLIAWGFDPVYFEDDRIDRRQLDAAVDNRPVVIMHANLHVMTVNSRMLALSQLDRHAGIEGIMLGDDGQPNGELQEMAAMHAIFETLGTNLFEAVAAPETLYRYGQVARNAGVTTITDLYNPLTDEGIAALRQVTQDPQFPARLVPALSALAWTPEQGVERLQQCLELGNDKLHFGLVKMMTDGSIQGYTARMKWPGYHDGHGNGIWNAPPDALMNMVQVYHQAGLQLHIHTNGDEAVELMLDAVESALELWPRADHRHTLQHCQIIDHAQLRRTAKLGLCLNMFANHIYYWGDIHRERTLGFERSRRLEPLASARRLGIVTAIHSDAPVTPLGPLFTAWCAVMRQSASGQVLGEHERVSVAEALDMITLGAAYTLRLDHLVGSLEVGKFADMAVLGQDPYGVDPARLRDIPVLATVLGGQVHANR